MKILNHIAIPIICLQMAACQGAWLYALKRALPQVTGKQCIRGAAAATIIGTAASAAKPIISPDDGQRSLPQKIEFTGKLLGRPYHKAQHGKDIWENGAIPSYYKDLFITSEGERHTIHFGSEAKTVKLKKLHISQDAYLITLSHHWTISPLLGSSTFRVDELMQIHFATLEKITLHGTTGNTHETLTIKTEELSSFIP